MNWYKISQSEEDINSFYNFETVLNTTDPEIIRKILEFGNNDTISSYAVHNKNILPDTLAEILIRGDDDRVSWEAAENIKTPSEALAEVLRRMKDDHVSWCAARNPNSPPKEAIEWRKATGRIKQEDPAIHDIDYGEKPEIDEDLEKLREMAKGENKNWYSTYKFSSQLDPKHPEYFPREILNYILKSIKSKGYDIYSVEDILDILKKRTNTDGKNLLETHEDWKDSFEKAKESLNKRKDTLKKRKEFQQSSPHVDWNRIRELGYTDDLHEAGYITPDGRLIDLSGKKEGGHPNQRALDHREAGGTKGMQSLMALGYIRTGITQSNYGIVHMVREPTPAQYSIIEKIVNLCGKDLVIDMSGGLGEEGDSGFMYGDKQRSIDYTREFLDRFSVPRVINDIRKFFHS